MIQCEDCEFFSRGPTGQIEFRCDPFKTIKEPDCLVKWQLLRASEQTRKIDRMVAAYEAMLDMYRRLQPLQEKMFRHMERELDDAEDADSWKYDPLDDDDDQGDDERDSGNTWTGQ